MTGRGIRFLVFFALLLFLALATGSSEIFLATFAAGLLLTFALVSAWAGVFALRIEHVQEQTSVIRGESVVLRQRVKGWLMLPVVLRIALQFPGNQQRLCAVMLWGGRHKAFSSQPECPHRGVWSIGIQSARVQDVFGFFSLDIPARRMLSPLIPLTVYPRLYELEGMPPPPTPTMDYTENDPLTADHGDSFADTRLYRHGDLLKRIHWKLSVRTQQLHTRQYETSVDRKAVIVIDTQVLSGESPEDCLNYADTATECGAALALYYAGGGHRVCLVPVGDEQGGLCINTLGDFPAAHTLLAVTPFDTADCVTDVIEPLMAEASRFSAFYVITRQPAPALMDRLARVTALHCFAAVVYPEKNANSVEHAVSPEGVRLIPIGRPQDILQRLGEWT